MTQANLDSVMGYYVPRTVSGWSEADIVAWVRGKKGLSRENDRINKRLLSIIGPPGSGKTTFLRRLEALLSAEPGVFALYLDLSATVDASGGSADDKANEALHNALREQIKARMTKEDVFLKLSLGYDDTAYFPLMLAEAIRHLCRHSYSVVVLLDQVDDVADEVWQVEIEKNVIASLLYGAGERSCARVIIARREEQKIIDSQLKWEDVVGRLEDLTDDRQKEQIARRLRDLEAGEKADFEQLNKDVAPGREQLRDEDINRILAAVRSDRDKILDALAGWLTGNPLINADLLRQSLLNSDKENYQIGRDELQNALAKYWQRAGLEGEEHKQLRETLEAMARGWSDKTLKWDPTNWTQVDYTRLRIDRFVEPPLQELEQAFKAGVIMLVEITRRYRIDPTLVQLVTALEEPLPDPTDPADPTAPAAPTAPTGEEST